MTSIVIPAHNEERVLARCLESILEQTEAAAQSAPVSIIVAANACTDGTVEVAKRYAARGVHVVEIDTASKVAALQAGDEAAGEDFPRMYIDADVRVGPGAIAATARVLSTGAHAAAPALHVNVDGRPLPVRWFYRDFLANPWLTDAPVGSGFYAMSREGRARFDRWPDILNDDGFVQNLFAREERATADGWFEIQAPFTSASLVRAKARVLVGNAELARLQADGVLPRSKHVAEPGGLIKLALRSARHPLIATNAVWLRSRIRREAREMTRRPESGRAWNQDLTTR